MFLPVLFTVLWTVSLWGLLQLGMTHAKWGLKLSREKVTNSTHSEINFQRLINA